MQYYYSQSTTGCYVDVVHGTNLPDDAIEITENEHAAIHDALSSGEKFILERADGAITIECAVLQLSKEEATKQRITEIQSLLTANDLASVRPLRAKLAGTSTDFDDNRLAELEEQAQALRAELVTLSAVV